MPIISTNNNQKPRLHCDLCNIDLYTVNYPCHVNTDRHRNNIKAITNNLSIADNNTLTSTENNKICRSCNKSKTTDNFYKDSSKKDGLCSKCINCYNYIRYTKYEATLPKYNNSSIQVSRKFCELCDCDFITGNFQKHLLGTRHQVKLKQAWNNMKIKSLEHDNVFQKTLLFINMI